MKDHWVRKLQRVVRKYLSQGAALREAARRRYRALLEAANAALAASRARRPRRRPPSRAPHRLRPRPPLGRAAAPATAAWRRLKYNGLGEAGAAALVPGLKANTTLTDQAQPLSSLAELKTSKQGARERPRERARHMH